MFQLSTSVGFCAENTEQASLYLGFTVLWISSDTLQGKGAGGLDDDDEEPDEDEEEEEP